MIEVFKTTVTNNADAERIVELIQLRFPGCIANFDLQDCDHILRIKTGHTSVSNEQVTSILHGQGFKAGVLPDTVPNVSVDPEGNSIVLLNE